MAEVKELRELINLVVEVREKAQEAITKRTEALQSWQEANKQLYTNENDAKTACQIAEDALRFLALQSYAKTGEKSVAPGIGIRLMTRLAYEDKEAMSWAMEHKLALKLDFSAFEKIAKTSDLPFVSITEEPSATIATVLNKVE